MWQIIFLSHHTIAWCIETQTKLENCIRDVASWAEGIQKKSVQSSRLELMSLVSTMNLLMKETEKVCGYIAYLSVQLQDDQEDERERAYVSVQLIKKYMNELAKECNAFMQGEISFTEKSADFLVGALRSKLKTVLEQMEKVQPVEAALGYENKNRTETFERLKLTLDPEIQRLREGLDEVGELKDEVREMRRTVAWLDKISERMAGNLNEKPLAK